MNEINKKRFHYSQIMEFADWEFFGIQRRPHGFASAYGNYKVFKKRCREFINKIRKRINEIVTNDIYLRETLLADLDIIDEEIKKVSLNSCSEIDIIGALFTLVAHLLGWDCINGKYYRTPIFYQSKEQEIELYENRNTKRLPKGLFEGYYRHKLIKKLIEEGQTYNQIALIFNITVNGVRNYEKADHLSEMYHKHNNQT